MTEHEKAGTVTSILEDINAGRATTSDLLALVYDDLRRQASSQIRRRRVGHTLHTTALVHEVAGRLLEYDKTDWESRVHFFVVAAKAMRQVLADTVRNRNALKRGGAFQRVAFNDSDNGADGPDFDIVALHEALVELQTAHERMAQVVECRFFAGMELREIAHALSVSISTVEADWRAARAWLGRELSRGTTA